MGVMQKKGNRNFPRIEIGGFVSYVAVNREKTILSQGIAKVINLSQGGLLLETTEPVEAPYVLLSLVDAGKKDLSFLGQVTHSENGASGQHRIGIRFIEKAEKRKQVVTRLVRAHSHQKNLK
jgi:hypothetical protein